MTLRISASRWDNFRPDQQKEKLTEGRQISFPRRSAYGLGTPTFIVPASGKDNRTLSTNSTCAGLVLLGMVDLLAANGITLDVTNKYGQGLLQVQRLNFSPR